MPNITICDTNIAIKLVFFSSLDINRLNTHKYGTLKFHPIVIDELDRWVQAANKGRVSKKINRLGLDQVKKALKLARQNTQCFQMPTPKVKTASFGQYKSEFGKVKVNSADPSDEDLLLIYHAESLNSYLVTCDQAVLKLGKRIIKEKAIDIENLLTQAVVENVLDIQDVKDLSANLDYVRENFNLSRVLMDITKQSTTKVKK